MNFLMLLSFSHFFAVSLHECFSTANIKCKVTCGDEALVGINYCIRSFKRFN